MNDAGGIFYAHELLAGSLAIAFGASEARQNQRLPAGDEVAAIQLRRDLHRQPGAPESLPGVLGVRRRAEEVSPERDEDFHLSLLHRLDGFDGVVPVFARRRE